MRILLRVTVESFYQAIQQLMGNRLRSFLSLMGITIGIFCIISVKSAVNSLENDIRKSLDQLGNDVVYIQKMPWNEDPEMNYWKYMRRPNVSFADFEGLKKQLPHAEYVGFSYFLGPKTIKWEREAINNGFVLGVTNDYGPLFNVTTSVGRFFTESEYATSAHVALIGDDVGKRLFGTIDPVGRDIQIMGKRMRVLGVIEKKGESIINVANFDEAILIPFSLAKNMTNTRSATSFSTFLGVKAKPGVNLASFKDEIISALRSQRRLKPFIDNNFAINELSMLKTLLDNVFGALNLAGFVIGIFAMLVGMFSVANIMFVSVKERTNIIGIKKALGAQKYMILLEFLIESTVLCLIGGLFGLLLVALMMLIGTLVLDFNLYLSLYNAATGVVLSVVVGIVSGLIPAWQAANLDPVEAIRQ